MTRLKIVFTLLLCVLLASEMRLSAQVTDEQVISYIKKAVASGKDKSQIGKELIAKGVKEDQLRRLYEKYSSGDITAAAEADDVPDSPSYFRQNNDNSRARVRSVAKQEAEPQFQPQLQPQLQPQRQRRDTVRIFGQDIFASGSRISFEPNENSATPKSYVLGPGDEIIIDVWGTSEATIKQTISPEGRIMIPQIGPVQLSGLTIDAATKKLKRVLSAKYSIDGQYDDSKISVTLGSIRTVQVNILGEVNIPGTYRLSAFSTVFNAIYRAGGVTPVGSLRSIKVMRDGVQVGTSDLYAFMFDGTVEDNVSLREGDVILVPPFSALVEVVGGVKRPMRYETKSGESLEKILGYAGGFSSDAAAEEVAVESRNGEGGEVIMVPSSQYSKFGVHDGDKIYVHTNNRFDLLENRAEIQGSVVRPGVYALGNGISGVKELVEHSGGLLEEAFRNRAQIVREKPDRSTELIAVALGSIMDGSSPDVRLQKNDLLVIYDKNKLEPKGDLTINGYVADPGDYPFAEGITIEDLILMAGGLRSGASSVRVDVSRRIDDSSSTTGSTTLAEVFSFSIKDGMMVDGKPDFVLKPYDIVAVRKSPVYVEQRQVVISGEVAFPGQYTLVSSNERLSDLLLRAGGTIPTSYVNGAVLRRKYTQTDRNVNRSLIQSVGNKVDSMAVAQLEKEEDYVVGIDLSKAVACPGGDEDIVLCDGDVLIVPSYSETVNIAGEVLYPNAVSYVSGMSVSYYVNQAGGFSEKARRGKVYVVHMNGHIDKGMGARVDPGSVIMVPSRPEKQKLTVGEWLGIGTTAASLTTMFVTIANLLK